MIRLTARFLGFFILASAFAALAIDVSRSLAGGSLALTQIGQTAAALAPAKLALLQNAIDPHAHPLLDQTLTRALRLPTFLVVGAVGVVFLWLARTPRPKIGYSSR
ncbi:MAG: hypothetical protein WDN46_08550 [Methylocella sp.]